MRKVAYILLAAASFSVIGCSPATVTKSYSEEWTDPHTGKKITVTESITQTPESRMPIHLKHPELYE